jgi:hypothetical protein
LGQVEIKWSEVAEKWDESCTDDPPKRNFRKLEPNLPKTRLHGHNDCFVEAVVECIGNFSTTEKDRQRRAAGRPKVDRSLVNTDPLVAIDSVIISALAKEIGECGRTFKTLPS